MPESTDAEWPMQPARWKSTGPRTAAGIERIKAARTVHGLYSRETRDGAQELRELVKQFRKLQRSAY